MPLSSTQMEENLSQQGTDSRIPPLDSATPTSTSTQTQTFLPPVQGRNQNLRQGVFSQSQSPPVSATVITATFATPPLQSHEGPCTIHETGGPSNVPTYSPTRPSLDEASIRLPKHLSQNSPASSSRAKGISFEEGRSGDGNAAVSKLQEEVGI